MSKIYSYEEVIKCSEEYFNGDELAAKVWVDKYALRDLQNNILEKSPDDMHRRLAKEFYKVESKYSNPISEEEIYQLFKGFKYIIPQGSPMAAIGDFERYQSSSNCFVIDSPLDSYAGILKTDQEMVQIMKRRGGVGFDISNIRPKGMITKNAARTTDGLGVFMERFSNSCREVAMGGRRGALLMSISVHHPEVETFIKIKKDKTKVTGANISIRISDKFMKAVKENKTYIQQWPIDSDNPQIKREVNAKEVWDKIIDSAWASAEPGVLFWDNAIKNTPSDIYKEEGYGSISTNPCGEIVLSSGDSCRLMVLNTTSFVDNPFTDKSKFNFKLFSEYVQKAQRLMDDMIDIEVEHISRIIKKIEKDPEPIEVKATELNLWNNIKKTCGNGRRTGLGITGLGDTIAMLNVKYGSKESIKITDEIYKTLAINSYTSSIIMAKERGYFPVFKLKKEEGHEFLNRIISELSKEIVDMYKKYGRRNIANTTTAPVGSVSTLTQTSSGIEPVFMLEYKRRKKVNSSDINIKVDYTDNSGDKWQEFTVYHHGVKKWMNITGEKDISKSPYHKATANEIDWLASVDIQATAQHWLCHSISKTCNLPSSATKEMISEIYMKAWKSGCKGFTIYREGCRDGVLVALEKKPEKTEITTARLSKRIIKNEAPKRPKVLSCEIQHVKILKKLDKLRTFEYCAIVGLLEGDPYEIFVFENGKLDKKYKTGKLIKDKKGKYDLILDDVDNTKPEPVEDVMKDQTSEEEALTRMVSTSLRHGVDVGFIVYQFEKVKSDNISSFEKAVARSLKKYIKNGFKINEKCPNCGADSLVRQEGCIACTNCSYSKCS